MINYVVCDLFLSPATVLVNTVNTEGVMGKGIAREFKQIYPEMFREYQTLCERGLFDVGKLHWYKTANKWVLNFPTKKHWRRPSEVEYIRTGLKRFVATYHEQGVTAVSFPQLGCGNGELDWDTQVQPLMEEYLSDLPITIFVHLTNVTDPFTEEHYNISAIKKWLRHEPEALAFTEVWDDLSTILANSERFVTPFPPEEFTAAIDQVDRHLILTIQGVEHVIPYDSMTVSWQQIRQSGFVAGSYLPEGLHAIHRYLLTLLAHLPYVELVVVSDRPDAVADLPLGLRLQPRPLLRQFPLFATAGVVEPVSAG